MLKIVMILGTRPEIIKFSPIILSLTKDFEYLIIHTGQHYSYNLDKVFFEDLEIPLPRYNLEVGSGSHAEEIGKMLIGIERILKTEAPDIVLVQGDTNSTLAGALSASKMNIKIGHVEAGLRSYDRQMPEEINRILTDRISDFLFVPTIQEKQILLAEGTPRKQVYVTGNTIVDAVQQNLRISNRKSEIMKMHSLTNRDYFLLTLHRQENVDQKEKLIKIFKGLSLVYMKYKYPIIFPIHPRTRKMLTKFGIDPPKGISMIEPVSFLDFLQLEMNSRLIFTDSGGIQEESCILKKPCVTLRENTERPETLDVGSNILAGTEPKNILSCTDNMMAKKLQYKNPFGDGRTGKRIVEILRRELT